MKNPNSPWNRLKTWLKNRWSGSDYPGGEQRFQVLFFAKDVATFVLLPVLAVILSRAVTAGASSPKRKAAEPRKTVVGEAPTSQVLEFGPLRTKQVTQNVASRAPGTLVKVRLLNSVEAYSTTPVHAQIIDGGLGGRFLGGVLIGDGASDTGVQRINITFRFARDPRLEGTAFPVTARALSLNGTLGIEAFRKEGIFARSVYRGAQSGGQDAQAALDALDLKSIVIKALSAGLLQEFGGATEVERNRAQVLALKAGTEFFAELTDYFPTSGK